MIKLVFCCVRRPELSPEAFQRTWLDDHGPLVTRMREKLPGMKRYVQSHTLYGPGTDMIRASRGAKEPYDGITEVWFDTLEDIAASGDEALAAATALLEDERRMLDLERCAVFLTEEHEIF